MNNSFLNQQGKRAEEIFSVRITQGYIFRARDLGEKWPISDYYVEIDDDDNPIFFIVQVKSSRRGYNTNGSLRVNLNHRKLNQLVNYNAPTFFAGVNILEEKVYLIPLYKSKRTGLNQISNQFVLDVNDLPSSERNLRKLKREVTRFWKSTNLRSIKKNFKSKL